MSAGKSWWSRVSGDALEQAEAYLLEKAGVAVTPKHVKIDRATQLFTLRTHDVDKPLMVILHGCCLTSIVFYQVLRPLAERYQLLLVDLLGMGRSSRPQPHFHNREEAEAFFVESFERLRAIEGLERFVLVGHSFGGYVAGCYTAKYAEYVEQLLFLSPAGVPRIPKGYNYIESLKSAKWQLRWIMKTLCFLWVRDITPFDLLRKTGPISAHLVEFYSTHRLNGLALEDRKYMGTYLHHLNSLNESGEAAVAYILQPGAWAYHPLCSRLKGVNIPMGFLYGETDWMPREGAEELGEANTTPVVKRIVPGAGHHLYFDNPQGLAEEILSVIDEFTRKKL